ncbi:Hypothetical protein PEIBARAKI_4014 [Petrimonas sp. IBARAKI]|nr:Hypothetical protein PEIBARAKI_4014 [Petrimonas sp. IBARAKI]
MATKGTYSLRTIYLLKKFINNKYSTDERDELFKLLEKNENNKEISLVTKTLWQAIENTSNPLENQKHEDILRKEARKILRNISTKSNPKNRSHYIIGSAIGLVAAAVLIVFILKIPVLKNDLESVETNLVNYQKLTSTDKIKKVTLADGSIIYLNTNTTLSIKDKEQSTNTREVLLEEGEAFFEIAKDENRPFIVHTASGITTRVLGTSFNIQAYAELKNQEISVKTGRVQVSRSDEDQMILKSNNSALFDYENDIMEFRKIDGNVIGGWREGMVVFQRSNPKEIAFRLKQHYGIELSYNKSEFKDVEFSAIFPSEASIETIAETLSKIYKLEYKLKDNTLYLN